MSLLCSGIKLGSGSSIKVRDVLMELKINRLGFGSGVNIRVSGERCWESSKELSVLSLHNGGGTLPIIKAPKGSRKTRGHVSLWSPDMSR